MLPGADSRSTHPPQHHPRRSLPQATASNVVVRGRVKILRTRTAAPSTDLRRCGTRSAPRSRGRRSRAAQSRGATGALPEVLARHDETQRPAMLRRQRLAVGVRDSSAPSMSRNDAGTFAVKPASAWAIAWWALGRWPTRSRIAAHGTPVKFASNRLQRVTQWMSCVTVVCGKIVQLRPRQGQRRVDLAVHAKVPAGEVRRVGRDAAGVEDGPLLREVLAGREPGRVVARIRHLPLRLAPEHARYSRLDGRLDVTRGPTAQGVRLGDRSRTRWPI